MRVVATIDDQGVIERILRHLGIWDAHRLPVLATGPPDGEQEAAGGDVERYEPFDDGWAVGE